MASFSYRRRALYFATRDHGRLSIFLVCVRSRYGNWRLIPGCDIRRSPYLFPSLNGPLGIGWMISACPRIGTRRRKVRMEKRQSSMLFAKLKIYATASWLSVESNAFDAGMVGCSNIVESHARPIAVCTHTLQAMTNKCGINRSLSPPSLDRCIPPSPHWITAIEKRKGERGTGNEGNDVRQVGSH